MDARVVAWERRFRWVCVALAVMTLTAAGFAVAEVFRRDASRVAALPAPPARSSVTPRPLRAGEAAPAFDLATADGGRRVSLASLRGRGVVIVTFASCCFPQEYDELDAMRRVAAEEAHGGPVVLGIMQWTSPRDARAFVDENHVAFPVLVDDGPFGRRYGDRELPAHWFITKDGRIASTYFGAQPARVFRAHLAAIALTRRGR